MISADDQLIIPSGGDNQTILGYIGDAQLSSSSFVNFINVSSQANETPVSPPPASSSVSAGSGNAVTITLGLTESFSLDKNELSLSVSQGEVKTLDLVIKNNLNSQISIQIQPSPQIQDLLKIPQSISLLPGESKTITIYFIATSDLNPDLYAGKLDFISEDGTEEEVFVAINVQSPGALLDVGATIPQEYQQIKPGDVLLAQINLFNLGSESRVDVELEYALKDFNGNVILDQRETVAVQTQAGFVRSFIIPKNVDYGKYAFYVKASYNGKSAGASANFEVVPILSSEKIYIIVIICLVIVIAGFVGFMILRRLKRRYRQIKRIGSEDLIWR